MKYGRIIASLLLASTLSTAYASNNAQKVTVSKVNSDYAKTKYPVVFVHGMAGFIRAGDVLGLDYWYQILPDLARNGTNTWATRVSPFNSTEVRGEQLAQQVEEILAITGSQKVNLIGHSHGGPTSRYVAGIMPTQVASVTAVETHLSPVYPLTVHTLAPRPDLSTITRLLQENSFETNKDLSCAEAEAEENSVSADQFETPLAQLN